MEIFLWLIVYLTFVLPVTKCFSMESSSSLDNALVLGLIWPVSLPVICFFETLGWLVNKLAARLKYLIED